jgi:hypothetical protein
MFSYYWIVICHVFIKNLNHVMAGEAKHWLDDVV